MRIPKSTAAHAQAVLLMTAEAVDELTALGYPIYYGAMGENLTTRGLDRRLLRVGQQYRVGSALIELTKVRVPARSRMSTGHPSRRKSMTPG